jgi:transposase-like protein
MGRAGAKKVPCYSLEFKQTTVRLSQLDGIEVQAVAAGLDFHPFMLSRWRKEGREGKLRGQGGTGLVKPPKVRERTNCCNRNMRC